MVPLFRVRVVQFNWLNKTGLEHLSGSLMVDTAVNVSNGCVLRSEREHQVRICKTKQKDDR